ncbi:hypothetical protein HRW09_32380 [Streptomyces lunaelactis]|nr:hypothetical protein [Streptomyces lunaelactis]
MSVLSLDNQRILNVLQARPGHEPVRAKDIAREGAGKPVPRGHSEEITVDGEAEPVSVRLGVFLSNTKARRDKLTGPQRAALAELGVEWV